MWLLALKAMLGDRTRLAMSLLGVIFSVILVNLQGALLLGMIQKASMLVDHGQADIWVGPRHVTNVEINGFIPQRWVTRIRGLDGVERADPYIVMFSALLSPDGRLESVVVVGADPSSPMGHAWVMAEGNRRDVTKPDAILVDVNDKSKLGDCRIGDVREINGRRARIVGITDGIVSFTTSPYIFTTLERARHYAFAMPPEHCTFYLVKARPGTDVRELARRIQQEVPSLDVYDRDTYSFMAMWFWLTRTGIGISFGLAAVLGLLVGLAVVAQTLYASVAERIKEFGTLKALGADDRCVGQFLIVQSLGNAVVGSLIGIVLVILIAASPLNTPRAPIKLTWQVVGLSVVLVSLVCLLAVWLPYRRVQRIDPASVLRA